MAAADLGRWEPLALTEAVGTFATAPFRWWVSGGHALELHLDRSWRAHDDLDIAVVRDELHLVREHLTDWELHVAAGGRLTPWTGQPLQLEPDANNLWCRRGPDTPWIVDITVGEGSSTTWAYRRDRRLTVPWDDAVLRTADGVPYLAPELQLLFKSKGLRPKDHADAVEVIESLDRTRRERLSEWLPADHPWQELV